MVSFALSGCAVIRQEYGRPLPEIGQFVDGKSHYSQVLDGLGPPAQLSVMDEGMVFLYERVALTEKQLGIDIDYEHIPILKIVVGRGKAEGETAAFLFDQDGTLMCHERESWTRD
jgi:hypothetical protein